MGNSNFLKGLIGFSLGVWISYIISFVSAPITTRLFSPEEYGKISVFITYSGLLSALAIFGMDQVFVRFYREVPGEKSKSYLFTYCLLIGVAISFGFGFVLLVGNEFISQSIVGEIDHTLTLWLFLFFLSQVIYKFIILLYRVETNIKDFTILTVLNTLCLRLAFIFAGVVNPSYELVIVLIAVSSLTLSLLYLVRVRGSIDGKFKLPTRAFVSETNKVAIPSIPSTLLAWLSNSMGLIVLNRYASYEDVGIYTAATALAGTILIVKSGFDSYWSPYVYQNYQSENNNFWSIHKVIAMGLLAFSISIILLQKPISLLLGPEYRAAMAFFPFLLINPVCYTLAETTSVGIGIAKKNYVNIPISIITIIVNLVCCLIFVPKFGGAGAALSSAIASVAYLIVRTYVGEKYYKSVKNYFYIFVVVSALFVVSFVNYKTFGSGTSQYMAILVVCLFLAIIFSRDIIALVKSIYAFVRR